MNVLLKPCLAATALAVSLSSAAQVTLYGQENLRGRAITLDESVADLVGSRLDDRASSIFVRDGNWQLCSEPHFRGTCITVGPGEYGSLRAAGLNNRVSSVRELGPPPRDAIAVDRGIVLFEQPNFGGASVRIDGYLDRLDRFNDRARSMIVYGGEWELCQHDRFRGDCMVFREGEHAYLGPLSGDVSSVRQLSPGRAPVAVAPVPVPPPSWNASRAVLFEDPNFRGRTLSVEQDLVRDLRDTGFDDRAASVRVEGGPWVLCTDPNFQGQCWTFNPGDYPVLPSALADRVTSARRVPDETPPYERDRLGRR
jgi:hypothetical protein